MEWKNIVNLKNVFKSNQKIPVAVKTPREHYETYRDVGRVLVGYDVEVTYQGNETEKRLFVTDEDKFGLINRRRALIFAMSFYKKTKAQIRKHQGVQNENKR